VFSLSKLADKTFIVAYLLPVVVWIVAVAALLGDVAAFGPLRDAVLSVKDFTDLTVLALAVWGLAILLMLWNHPLYQLLEGYIGAFRSGRRRLKMQARFDAERRTLRASYERAAALEGHVPDDDPDLVQLESDYLDRRSRFKASFPYARHLVLPRVSATR
jgi:hypothetical protein